MQIWLRNVLYIALLGTLTLILLTGVFWYSFVPSQDKIALVNMGADPVSQTGVGLILNNTDKAWVVYLLVTGDYGSNPNLETIVLNGSPMQAVEYHTPKFQNTKEIKQAIIFAKELRN